MGAVFIVIIFFYKYQIVAPHPLLKVIRNVNTTENGNRLVAVLLFVFALYSGQKLLVILNNIRRISYYRPLSKTTHPRKELVTDFNSCGHSEMPIINFTVMNIFLAELINHCVKEKVYKLDLNALFCTVIHCK